MSQSSKAQIGRKDVIDIYENGKHRRYSLLFAVNGGVLAIAKLIVGGTAPEKAALGGLRLWMLAVFAASFSFLMGADIWAFGSRMKDLDDNLFDWRGKTVLALLTAILMAAWLIVGFGPPPP